MSVSLLDSHWLGVGAGDARAKALHRRHYSFHRKTFWSRHATSLVGPGERMVLLTLQSDALFVWRRELYRLDGQEGINCALFRNESPELSSEMIREADELAAAKWPGERHFTFVNPRKIKSSNPGYCFLRAGWRRLEERTAKGLVVLEFQPEG